MGERGGGGWVQGWMRGSGGRVRAMQSRAMTISMHVDNTTDWGYSRGKCALAMLLGSNVQRMIG